MKVVDFRKPQSASPHDVGYGFTSELLLSYAPGPWERAQLQHTIYEGVGLGLCSYINQIKSKGHFHFIM